MHVRWRAELDVEMYAAFINFPDDSLKFQLSKMVWFLELPIVLLSNLEHPAIVGSS